MWRIAFIPVFLVLGEMALGDSPYEAAWPPPGGLPKDNCSYGDVSATATLAPQAAPATPAAGQNAGPVFAAPSTSWAERPDAESTWYFRQEAFYWNERYMGADFVNEYGPLSTLGYQHRHGVERYRLELFGGTVAYDGAAQYDDGTTEEYHQSCGTDYLGVRAEYDLLIAPDYWTKIRLFAGVGTRFWFRNLNDAVTPSGADVYGYQETWWTFYPYIGLETKESSEPGPKLFTSMRVGLTPLTYEHVTYFDTTLYPRCGITAQMELGVRFQQFSVSAYLEGMTWGESAVVRDSLQPESRMLTIGGKLAYSF